MIRARWLGTMRHFRKLIALLLLAAFSLWLALFNAFGPAAAQNSGAPFWAPTEAGVASSENCTANANALKQIESKERFSFTCSGVGSANIEGYGQPTIYISSNPNNPRYDAVIPNNREYYVLNFRLEWSYYGRNLPSDIIPPFNLNSFTEGLDGAIRFPNRSYFSDTNHLPPPVPSANRLCPGVVSAVSNIYSAASDKRLPNGAFVTDCVLSYGNTLQRSHWTIAIDATLIVPRPKSASAPVKTSACTTDLLKGPWRAENAELAKTGHAVTFAVSTGGAANHDGNQKRYRGEFTTYPAHKRLLGLAPTPMFTDAKAYAAGKDLCLIPMVINMRDSGVSRSAALIDTKNGSLRFVNEQAYRFKDGSYQIYADQLDAQAVAGAPGRWLRGAAAALPTTCTPADFNGRWDRSDGARVTIRGAGTQGVGGTGSMDDHPENWVRGQDKYTSMRMKSACVYTAKCYASQRTTINGRPDFKMVETACELVIDPETKTLRERGTSNTYSYTKAGAGAAARKPPSAVTPPEPAQPSQAVQSLNSEQAAAAKREIQAYEARKKAIADEQAAKEAAYRQALADREALIAENNRRASEARAKWEASVAACRAGDQSQCAPQPQR
ncbi:cell envelope integrity protein TolA [Sphingopyxis sp.]|uniref:cell envelope integrity protein TolA n=1 Tax=Sphingopyxis sp. TaxID=1908224 RepID=UPI003D0BD7FF